MLHALQASIHDNSLHLPAHTCANTHQQLQDPHLWEFVLTTCPERIYTEPHQQLQNAHLCWLILTTRPERLRVMEARLAASRVWKSSRSSMQASILCTMTPAHRLCSEAYKHPCLFRSACVPASKHGR